MNNFTQNVFASSENSFKNFVAVCSFLLVSGLSFGQMTFTSGTGLTQTQNFDGLPLNTTTNNINVARIGQDWFRHDGTTQSQALTGNVVTSQSTGSLAHGVYNSATSASTTDRALGLVASGTGVHRIGVRLVNSTGVIVNGFSISGNVEKYRNGSSSAVTERVLFEYSINATSLSTGTWVAVSALDLVEPDNATVQVTTAVDGNLAINKSAFSGSIGGLTLANNSGIWIRWRDVDESGTDALLALDDISITASLATSAPTVSTTTASSITTSSAISGGNVSSDGGAALTAKGVVFGTSANPTTGTDDGTATGSFTSTLSSLSPNTQYFYRAYATNSVGTSYGTESSFNTLANVPGVVTVGNPQVTTLGVTVNATTENSNPTVTVYAIHETTTNQFVQSDGSLGATAVWQSAATWSTITVTGLTQNTTYTFEAKARNQASVETAYGATASGTTLANQTTDWCILQSPTSQTITEGASFNVYTQAYKGGLTEAPGQGVGLSAWVGYSTTNTNPNGAGWTWVNASFNTQIGNNDEFIASLGTGLTPGTYYYASRFQIGSGSFTYGGTGGVWNNDNAVLTVNADLVDYCNVSPSGANIVSEGTVYSLYSEVYEPGITPGAGQGSGITAYIGYSTTNNNPTSAGWTWIAATYQNESGNNDVYKIDLPTTLTLGNYYFASRYIKSTSSTYQYGDTTGIWNNNNGTFTVVSNVVDYCNVAPSGINNSEEGNVFTLYSDVYELGVTPGAGQGAGIVAYIGYSSTNNDPSVSSGWTWVAATYHSESGNNDVYRVDLPSNLALGTYYFASRYQKTGSSEFRYGGTNGFWNNDNGVLNVVSNLVDYCNIQFPLSGNITQGDVYTVYAQVYEPGVTPGAGQGTGITAQIGYSTSNSTPDNTWTWLTPTYHAAVTGNNDEYMVDLASGLAPGTYYYASRFQKTGSTQYQYGGTNGVWNNDNGTLVVNQAVPVVTGGSPTGTVNVPFTYTISATNSPTSYAIVSGTLPAGLSLNTTSGLISGTPTTAGSVSVDVTATNSGGTSIAATLNFTVAQGSQTITFGALTPKTIGDPSFALTATSSSGLTVSYISSNTAVATVSGNIVTIVGAGSTVITASQSGDVNYAAAPNVNQTLVVNYPVIAGWDFTGFGATTVATVAATTFNSNLVSISGANNITRGPGAAWSNASNSFRTQGFQNNGIATTNTDYFQTTLSVGVGRTVSLGTVTANLSGTASFAASPGVSSQFAYSLDGTNFILIGTPVVTVGTPTSLNIDLSGVAALQNVPSGTTITIRYYASGQTSTGGWGFLSATPGTNGLAFTGYFNCVTPTVFNVSGGGTICSTATSSVSLSGSQIGINYQLKLDGSNVGTAVAGTGSALSFTNLSSAGTYTVEASNTNGTCANLVAMTGNAVISVVNPATITTQPQSQTVCEGSATIFTVALTGSTNYSYEWKKDGIAIPGAPDLASYTIASTTTADGAIYSVDVFDDCLNLISSNNATLTVTPQVTPAFTQVAPICNGGALSSLPTTSNNGIVGTWSPVINNTTTTTYTFTPDSGQCAPTVTMTIVVGGTTTWTITAPATSPAWDNGVPTSTMTAIIAADYSEAANIDACTLTVNNNAVVTIPSGSNVTLNGTLTVVTGSSFTLNNNANLVQTSNAANSGDITVKRTTNPLMRFDYVMWSSPVDGTQSLLNFSPLTSVSPTVRFYTYNSSNDQYVSVGSPSTTEFQNATGYLIRLPFNHPTAPAVWNGSFVGQPNNGPISLGSLTSGLYYATGNPYPSTIDADSFITVNGLDDALYFWRKTNGATGSAYATYTLAGGTTPTPGTGASPTSAVPNGTIQVGQGFLAKATSTSFEFNNQMRIANNANQTFRSASSALSTTTVERNRIWLNLSNATATIGQTMVSYMTGATNGIDAQIDGKYINDSQTALTSIITGQEFAVQGKTLPFDVTDVVPLGFKTETEGNFSISLYDKDGLFANTTQEIYLRDNQTGAVHNLNAGAYNFTSAIGTFNGRFEVIYQNALGIDTPSLTPNNVIVYNDNNVLTINTGIFDMASVKVFDIRGRLLTEKTNINATQTTLNVTETNQILLVQVTSNEGIVVTKKVVN